MKELKKLSLTLALASVLGFGLSGCGGGGSDGGVDTSNTKKVIDTGRSLGSSSFESNFVLGTNQYYKVTSSCTGNGLVFLNYTFYDDFSAQAQYTWNGNIVTTYCFIDDIYTQIDINNSDINATKITEKIFYDTNSEIFYITEYTSAVSSLIEIINDGLTAIGITQTNSEQFLQLNFACKSVLED